MNKVLDTQVYIIEPGTKVEDVISFFPAVHWSVARCSGIMNTIEYSKRTGKVFSIYVDEDNIPYLQQLKEVQEEC